jgi:hypothetical protein
VKFPHARRDKGDGVGRTPRRFQFRGSRSHDAVIRVYDDAGNLIEIHEQAGDFKEP